MISEVQYMKRGLFIFIVQEYKSLKLIEPKYWKMSSQVWLLARDVTLHNTSIPYSRKAFVRSCTWILVSKHLSSVITQ
jgi:hypothetical protein